MYQKSNALYLAPAYFVDSDNAEIQLFAKEIVGDAIDPIEKVKRLYYAVRDGYQYNPYPTNLEHTTMKASNFMKRKSGYCVEKSCLMAALARAEGIPSRLGFANVRNHIGTEKLEERLGTDVLAFHGFVELFLDGKWVKATPVFNRELCEKLGVVPLSFDGKTDSIFQEYDKEGGKFMEYLKFHGVFHDVPHDMFVMTLRNHYPHLFTDSNV